jgi:hypothetical protein
METGVGAAECRLFFLLLLDAVENAHAQLSMDG